MGKKEQKYCYGSQNYVELVCGTKVEPVPRHSSGSIRLRCAVPKGWKTSTKDVWREKGCGPQGTHFMLMMAAPDEKDPHGELIRRLGSWMDDLGLALVECICVKTDCGSILGAIVEAEP